MKTDLKTPERELHLLNRAEIRSGAEDAVETLAQLRARITLAKAREPKARDITCLCRRCRAIWTQGRDTIIREIEGATDP